MMALKYDHVIAKNLDSNLNKIASLLLLFSFTYIFLLKRHSIRHMINEDIDVCDYYDVYYCKINQNFNCCFK